MNVIIVSVLKRKRKLKCLGSVGGASIILNSVKGVDFIEVILGQRSEEGMGDNHVIIWERILSILRSM